MERDHFIGFELPEFSLKFSDFMNQTAFFCEVGLDEIVSLEFLSVLNFLIPSLKGLNIGLEACNFALVLFVSVTELHAFELVLVEGLQIGDEVVLHFIFAGPDCFQLKGQSVDLFFHVCY